MSGRLNSYLADIEEQAQERFERLIDQMKQAGQLLTNYDYTGLEIKTADRKSVV